MKNVKLIVVLLLILSSIGCVEPIRQETSYFNCKKFFLGVSDSLQRSGLGLEKSIISEHGNERKRIDAPIWKTELSPFIEIDINKPALRGAYSIKEESTPNMGKMIQYEALEPTTVVRKLFVEYDSENKVTEVWAVTATSNPYHASTDTLVYRSNGTYEIHASSDPELGRRIAFDLFGTISSNQ